MESGPAYEDREVLNQYLLFHYGNDEQQFPYGLGGSDGLDFPRRCVAEGVDGDRLPGRARALDLGCAVGRSTFELARRCTDVTGIDFSASFIRAAQQVQREGRYEVERVDEGERRSRVTVALDEAIDRTRVRFEVGDAQALRPDLGTFDVVIACNLVCRLAEPMKLLERLPDLVRPGGQLFLTTPFTWMESFTPPEHWLGRGDEGSFEALRRSLEPAFRLDQRFEMPFLIREHARKFQYGVALASRWTRDQPAT